MPASSAVRGSGAVGTVGLRTSSPHPRLSCWGSGGGPLGWVHPAVRSQALEEPCSALHGTGHLAPWFHLGRGEPEGGRVIKRWARERRWGSGSLPRSLERPEAHLAPAGIYDVLGTSTFLCELTHSLGPSEKAPISGSAPP